MTIKTYRILVGGLYNWRVESDEKLSEGDEVCGKGFQENGEALWGKVKKGHHCGAFVSDEEGIATILKKKYRKLKKKQEHSKTEG